MPYRQGGLKIKMGRKRISREKIINAFLFCAFDKSAGATSLQDIADFLEIKKASLYNHFGSKDEMYDATLVYCSDYLNFVNFIPEDINRDGKIYEEDAYGGFRKIIKRHIQLYENEPLFQIFTFVHSEKYFNKNAAEIAENELIKIERGIAELVKGFAEKEKLRRLPHDELRRFSGWFAAALAQQTDLYIMRKKEIVRQNPESGAGSLFSLPTDASALEDIFSQADAYLKTIAL